MSEMKKMNAVEIIGYLNDMNKETIDSHKVSFDLMSQATRQTIVDCVDLNGKIDYVFLKLFRTLNVTEAMLLSFGIEFVKSEVKEDNDIPEYFLLYDEMVDIYTWFSNRSKYVYEIEDMVFEMVGQMSKEQVQLGMFESRILEVMTKATSVIENISLTLGDKKKLKSVLQLVKRELPEIGNMINGIKDGKVE
jgi:hypothetical protein